MATKHDLQDWLIDALRACGGRGTIVQLAEHIWMHHRADLERSGNLLFTWQYDMRWAANALRRKKVIKGVDLSPRGVWELAMSSGT
jgi:hypothetical protein